MTGGNGVFGTLRERFGVMDRVGLVLLVAGALCVAFGALPERDAEASMVRIAPILLFLAGVIVLAELTREAGVFDVVAAWLARLAGGRYGVLFLLCVAFAAVTTVVLNLDTTAVLLTPVMLALAREVGVRPLPLAMTTVWLANTASLLLPVSNLTNLLAADRVGLTPLEFAGRMWAPQAVALAVTTLLLWVLFWRRGAHRYTPPEPPEVRDPVLFAVAGGACALFVAGVLAEVPIELAALVAAVVVVAAFVWRDRGALGADLVPWRPLVFVAGLFLVVPTIQRHGLNDLMAGLVGTGENAATAAGAGAVLANLVNNLPAYVAVEAVLPAGAHDELLALLAGVNLGSVVTPWGTLATLLWFESCRRGGLDVPLRTFVLGGLVLAATALPAAVAALVLT